MSIWGKPHTIRFPEERERQVFEIQDAMAPFLSNFSQVIDWCVDMVHTMIFRHGMLAKLLQALQELQRPTMCYAKPGALEVVPAGPVRVSNLAGERKEISVAGNQSFHPGQTRLNGLEKTWQASLMMRLAGLRAAMISEAAMRDATGMLSMGMLLERCGTRLVGGRR